MSEENQEQPQPTQEQPQELDLQQSFNLLVNLAHTKSTLKSIGQCKN